MPTPCGSFGLFMNRRFALVTADRESPKMATTVKLEFCVRRLSRKHGAAIERRQEARLLIIRELSDRVYRSVMPFSGCVSAGGSCVSMRMMAYGCHLRVMRL